jgi:hypothetical protein
MVEKDVKVLPQCLTFFGKKCARKNIKYLIYIDKNETLLAGATVADCFLRLIPTFFAYENSLFDVSI